MSECPDQPFNGVLLVRSKQDFYLEMVEGPMPNLISIGKTPDFIASRNLEHLPTSFSFDDETMRNRINDVLRTTRYYPGYYEFALARLKPDSEALTPYFYEYSNKSILYKW